MNPKRLVEEVTERWLADEESDVVWTGDHEGRRGVRMRQRTRDFTTVWFEVGERTLTIEAGVLPAPRFRVEEVYRQCLVRNRRTRRLHFAMDPEGEVILVGRIPVEHLDEQELDLVLGEAWELIEVAFRPMVAAGFGREKDA
ncbi:MAG: YbjN domain-containing protein [Acidimicrobiia bacterium]|nr:MAG: YbjN domain-containing protein [Acidimicrobiia bacterium]